MIICENVNKLFSNSSGIFDVNVTFMPGVVNGIIGFNGAGKTTLLRCIEGLYYPTSGDIFHDNINTKDDTNFGKVKKTISFLPADDFLYDNLTCLENIELTTILRTGSNKISKQTHDLLKYFEAAGFLSKKFGECSTGMKKKIQLISTLIGEVDTIIWDEPNDSLDIVSNIKLKNLIGYYKEMKKTIIITSHVAEFLDDFIDYFILLKNGKIVEENKRENIGSFKDVLLNHLDSQSLEVPFYDRSLSPAKNKEPE